MTDSRLEEQSNANLELQGWHLDTGKYTHSSGCILDLTRKEIAAPVGVLSPSSLELVDGCQRRFYLSRKPESKESRFGSVGGQPTAEPGSDSARALEGRILHTSMRLLVNDVLKDSGGCNNLGWRTILAPVIHSAVTAELKLMGNSASLASSSAEVEITLRGLLDTVDRITAEVFAEGIAGITFDRMYWTKLAKIKMDAEVPLHREGFTGYADLVASLNGEPLVVDYKTGKVPETTEGRSLDSRETMRILANPNHPLHSEAVQVSSYLWLLSSENAKAKAWTVHTKERPLQVIEYQMGLDVIEAQSDMIHEGVAKAVRILKSPSTPNGTYVALICNRCRFRMNCQALLEASEKADIGQMASELRRGTIPLLLKVSKIVPEESEIQLAMGDSALKVELSASHRNYLRQALGVLREGIDLLGFVRLRIGSDTPSSSDIEFARC